MRSLYLRFAGPAQSWAGARVTGNYVNTARIPTRSAMTGLAAAALGARHGEWPHWLEDLVMDVRSDHPGTVSKDYHTINPRPEAQIFLERVWAASGQKGRAPSSFTPDLQKGTSIVRRTYLSGAEFLVRISHDTHFNELSAGFASPGFSPYLGRKAFAPTFPFLLGVGEDALLEEAPTAATGPVGIHVVDGRDNSYPDRTVRVPAASLHQRLQWWAARASIPDRR